MNPRGILHRLAPGEPAPVISVFDAHGAPVTLSALWRERSTVLSFLRHFG